MAAGSLRGCVRDRRAAGVERRDQRRRQPDVDRGGDGVRDDRQPDLAEPRQQRHRERGERDHRERDQDDAHRRAGAGVVAPVDLLDQLRPEREPTAVSGSVTSSSSRSERE